MKEILLGFLVGCNAHLWIRILKQLALDPAKFVAHNAGKLLQFGKTGAVLPPVIIFSYFSYRCNMHGICCRHTHCA